ncbi:unnamed protein product, partial [Brachionus calyciflorus]
MSNNFEPRNLNLLIGVTGSVATIKLDELIDGFVKKFIHINICIIATKNSLHFIEDFLKFNQKYPILQDRHKLLQSLDSQEPVIFSFSDEDEWSSWSKRNDPVLHIELRKWADVFLIAPLGANTLAKISNGICDNLLTSVARAWDIENINTKPVIVCPAMNTCMFKHPLTKTQLTILSDQFGFTLIDPIEKILMCGDSGIGAMAKTDDIIQKTYDFLKLKNLF